MNIENEIYDVFLSYSHKDAEYIEFFAEKLEDEEKIKVWLDKWILIPGKPFRQELSKGLDAAKTCAVFVGKETPKGWVDEEINKAINRQTKDINFRVIPVLLPETDELFVKDFLEFRTWIDFRKGINDKRSFHELTCGIRGVKPGRKYISSTYEIKKSELEEKLLELKKVDHLIDMSVKIEIQKMIVIDYFKKDKI